MVAKGLERSFQSQQNRTHTAPTLAITLNAIMHLPCKQTQSQPACTRQMYANHYRTMLLETTEQALMAK